MQAAGRPRSTAAVAFVGASVIAAAAVSALPDVQSEVRHLPIQAVDVGLAALTNPLEIYAAVVQDALANAGVLAENADPAALFQQILQNQVSSAATLGAALQSTGAGIADAVTTEVPHLLQAAVTSLVAGDVVGAADALAQIPLAVGLPAVSLLPALQTVLTKPLQNLVDVIDAFTADPLSTELLLSGFIAPLISAPAAAAVAIQNVLGAAATANPAAVASALLAAPATIADGLLNGGYGPDLGPLVGVSGLQVKAGGLLSSAGLTITPDGSLIVDTGGPIAALQQVLQKITTAIAPPPTATLAQNDVASLPSADSTTVTLSTTTAPASVPTETAAGTGETAHASSPGKPESPVSTAESASTADSPTAIAEDKATEETTTDRGPDMTTGNKVDPKESAATDTAPTGAAHSTAGEQAEADSSAPSQPTGAATSDGATGDAADAPSTHAGND